MSFVIWFKAQSFGPSIKNTQNPSGIVAIKKIILKSSLCAVLPFDTRTGNSRPRKRSRQFLASKCRRIICSVVSALIISSFVVKARINLFIWLKIICPTSVCSPSLQRFTTYWSAKVFPSFLVFFSIVILTITITQQHYHYYHSVNYIMKRN